jgi:hypothetical protein
MNSHSDVFAPNTMALGHLCAAYSRQPGFRSSQDWKLLTAEVVRRINWSTFYTGVSVTEEELVQSVTEGDAFNLYLYPYYKGLKKYGATRLIIKEHQVWRLIPFFTENLQHVRIIVQVRDPRDYAVSCKKLGRLYSSYYGSLPRAARIWAKEQRAALQLAELYGASVVHTHRYEDLVTDTVATLRTICNFIGLEWDESMLNFHVKEAELARSREGYLRNMWANLDKPISPMSVGQWKDGGLRPLELLAVARETSSSRQNYYRAPCDNCGGIWQNIAYAWYKTYASSWYLGVTIWIWLRWLMKNRNVHVSREMIFGNSIREHHPYERFRDRIGYRL